MEKNKLSFKSIILAEFNDIEGPKIVCQYPKNTIVTNIDSHNLSDYIVPKPELCGKIIKVEFINDLYIICLPVEIKNERYRRKKNEFSASLIVDKENYIAYGSILPEVIRKITYFFLELEVFQSTNERFESQLTCIFLCECFQMDNQIIYKNDNNAIYKILKKIYIQMNNKNHCFIMTNVTHFLFLSVESSDRYNYVPSAIKDYEVPLPLIDLKQIEQDFEIIDPNFSKILAQINGVAHAKIISKETNIDIDAIKLYLQNLVFHKAIMMIDIFQFSNIYITTDEVHSFFSSPKKQEECYKACVKEEFIDKFDRKDIINFLIGFTNKMSIKDLIINNTQKIFKINLTKFINFCLVNKIIRRVHIYPIKKKNTTLNIISKTNYPSFFSKSLTDSPNHLDEFIRRMNNQINEFLDGDHCLDEICVYYEKSKADIEDKLKNFGICFLEK